MLKAPGAAGAILVIYCIEMWEVAEVGGSVEDLLLI